MCEAKRDENFVLAGRKSSEKTKALIVSVVRCGIAGNLYYRLHVKVAHIVRILRKLFQLRDKILFFSFVIVVNLRSCWTGFFFW